MSFVRDLPSSAAPADKRQALHFRVLSIGGVRKAFRLEPIFWTALGAIAERNRRTLAGEVFARLTQAPDSANHSSFLRAGAAADLLDSWEAAEARAAKPAWARVIGAMPTPAFAATGSGRVLSFNSLLGALLEARGLAGAELDGMTVELASGAIFQANKALHHAPVVCNGVFRAGAARARCRVRIVLADGPSDGRLVLGFADPD